MPFHVRQKNEELNADINERGPANRPTGKSNGADGWERCRQTDGRTDARRKGGRETERLGDRDRDRDRQAGRPAERETEIDKETHSQIDWQAD